MLLIRRHLAAATASPLSRRTRGPLLSPAAAAVAVLVTATLASCGGGGHDGTVGPTTGRLQVVVTGLPASTPAVVTVTGPGSVSRQVTASQTLSDLPAGNYVVAAAEVTTNDSIYASHQPQQNVAVVAGAPAATATVDYAVASGSLTVTITGLPAGTNADVLVASTGGSFTQRLAGTTTIPRLRSGDYVVTATAVASGGSTYVVATVPSAQTVTVTPGANSSAAVTFNLAPTTGGGANLVIDGLYIVQSVQRLDRAVPLVQGKDGLLRVFVRATDVQTPAPKVRVRLYRDGAAVYERIIAPPTQYAPTSDAATNEASLSTTWNLPVTGDVLTPGLTITAEVDPDNVVAEVNEGDNVFPSGGQRLPTEVYALPAFRLRFVPVFQSATGLVGDVNGANVERYLASTRKLQPVSTIDVDVRTPYTSTGPATSSTNDDTTWTRVLHEVDVARDLDCQGDPNGCSRYYYGVVRVSYTSGVAGLGYIGYPVAMGWDYLPSGSEVMAHELGHNWGRLHAPCGVEGADTAFPYAGGKIGAYGYDPTTGQLKPPSAPDIMGYCSGKWISDYTYNGVLNYRRQFPSGVVSGVTSGVAFSSAAADASEARGPVQKCLLVWGRVVNGQPMLEPAFEVMARPSLPRAGGPLTLAAKSASGATLWSLSFSGTEIADSPRGDRTFAFTIPVGQARAAEIAALRLAAAGRETLSRAGADDDASDVRVARAARPRWVRVRWDAARHPVLMVRDPSTGALLSFARGGDAEVRTPRDAVREVEVIASDRVRSVSRRVSVAQ